MTEAEKAQLRYVAIVQQARNMGAVGDFAKTLESPANALRILQQQLLQLSRTLGSVFIPILTAVLPYIQAFVKVVTQAISVLATWVGFKMPKWDNKSWGTSGVQALGGALDDATGKAKKLKGQVMGFDELNVLNKKDQGSGGGPNVGGGGDLGLDLESVWTDEMLNQIENKTNAIAEKMKDILKVVGAIGVAFASWKLAQMVVYFAKAVSMIKSFAGLKAILGFMGQRIVGISTKLLGMSGTLLPILGTFLAIGSAVYFLYKNWDMVVEVAQNFAEKIGLTEKLEAIKNSFMGLWEKLQDCSELFNVIGSVVSGVLFVGMSALGGAINVLVGIVQGAIDVFNGILLIFAGIGEFIQGVFTGDIDLITQSFNKMGEGCRTVAEALVNTVLGIVGDFIEGVLAWFSSLPDKVMSFMNNLYNSLCNLVSDLSNNIDQFAINTWNAIVNTWQGAGEWFNTTIIQPVNNFFSDMWEGLYAGGKEAWENIKNTFSAVTNYFGDIFSKAWQKVMNVFSTGGEIFINIKDAVLSGFKNIVNGLIGGINRVIAIPFNKINGIIYWLRDLSIGGIYKPFTSLRGIHVPQIPMLASGGQVDTGQMFIARERGPEMVGTMGGKTTVANNQQIVEGISQGVYKAVMDAMGQQNFNNDIYIDSIKLTKQVAKTNKKLERQTGRNLMFE